MTDLRPKELREGDYLEEFDGTVARSAVRERGVVEVWFCEPNLPPVGFLPDYKYPIRVRR